MEEVKKPERMRGKEAPCDCTALEAATEQAHLSTSKVNTQSLWKKHESNLEYVAGMGCDSAGGLALA